MRKTHLIVLCFVVPVILVVVFFVSIPVKNQLRLHVEPESNTASGIADFLTKSRHPYSPNP